MLIIAKKDADCASWQKLKKGTGETTSLSGSKSRPADYPSAVRVLHQATSLTIIWGRRGGLICILSLMIVAAIQPRLRWFFFWIVQHQKRKKVEPSSRQHVQSADIVKNKRTNWRHDGQRGYGELSEVPPIRMIHGLRHVCKIHAKPSHPSSHRDGLLKKFVKVMDHIGGVKDQDDCKRKQKSHSDNKFRQ